jgi:hypothetical protein
MKLSVLLLITAVLAALYGVSFIIAAPSLGLAYGHVLTLGGVAVMRLFGVALLGYAVLTWMARGLTDAAAQKAVIWTLLVSNGLGFAVSLYNQLHSMVNALGWTTVVVYGLLAAGYVYFAFRKTA